MANLVPAIFCGHGNPMNAVSTNRYTEAWRGIGEQMPRPNAILDLSALVCSGDCRHHHDRAAHHS